MSYLGVKAWVYGKLVANAGLISAMGGSSANILDVYPNTLQTLPAVVYSESAQSDSYFAENAPIAESSTIDIHVFTAFSVSTTAIAQAVDVVMSGLLFTRVFGQDLDDPSVKVRHKVLKYSRSNIVLADLV